MKIKKAISFILKVICLVFVFGGALMILGSAGALECDNITMLQCIVQVLLSVVVIATGLGIYVLREYFKHYIMGIPFSDQLN
jgi:hypothetical protein